MKNLKSATFPTLIWKIYLLTNSWSKTTSNWVTNGIFIPILRIHRRLAVCSISAQLGTKSWNRIPNIKGSFQLLAFLAQYDYILVKTIIFALGFSFVFISLGMAASFLGNVLIFFGKELRIAAGIIIILFSLNFIGILMKYLLFCLF